MKKFFLFLLAALYLMGVPAISVACDHHAISKTDVYVAPVIISDSVVAIKPKPRLRSFSVNLAVWQKTKFIYKPGTDTKVPTKGVTANPSKPYSIVLTA